MNKWHNLIGLLDLYSEDVIFKLSADQISQLLELLEKYGVAEVESAIGFADDDVAEFLLEPPKYFAARDALDELKQHYPAKLLFEAIQLAGDDMMMFLANPEEFINRCKEKAR